MITDPTIGSLICTNCGHDITGSYCSNCGQKKIELKDKSVKAFLVHFAEEFFTFDSRFLRTVKPLFFKPGYLTHEYISGRFVRYVTPLKLYLFTSIVSFFILITFDSDQYAELMEQPDDEDLIQQIIRPVMESKNLSEQEFKNGFNEFINGNIALSLFFVMFVFSVILNLVYIYKHIYYVEHLVFTLHFFTMVLIMITTGTILGEIHPDILTLFIFIFPCIYLLVSVKRIYHQKWINAVLATVFLSFIYWMLLAGWTLGLVLLASLMA